MTERKRIEREVVRQTDTVDGGRGLTERKRIEREVVRQTDRWRKRVDREKEDRKRG